MYFYPNEILPGNYFILLDYVNNDSYFITNCYWRKITKNKDRDSNYEIRERIWH